MTNESIACKGSCAYIFLLYSYFYRILFRGLNLEASNQRLQTRGFKLELQIRGFKPEPSNQRLQIRFLKPEASN